MFSGSSPRTGRNTAVHHQAFLKAFKSFARRYPRWRDSLIDEYFVESRVFPIIDSYVERQKPVDPIILASAWLEQIKVERGIRSESLQKLGSVMEELITLYEKELALLDCDDPKRDLAGEPVPC